MENSRSRSFSTGDQHQKNFAKSCGKHLFQMNKNGDIEAASRVILKSAVHKLPAFLEERITYENHVHGAS